jgi:hypothetical protein
MSTFLDIARPLAERGFRVFPLVPQQKFPVKMSWGDHFDAATTDITALEQWDKKVPSANVGLSPDEIFCYVETDSETEFKELCALPPEVWDTTRVSSGRVDRCYYIFRQTARTRKAGNLTGKSRKTTDNLFEFKQHRVLVVGPGSTHPKINPDTGEHYVYAADWKSIPALPDVLLNCMCELAGAAKTTDAVEMSEEVKAGTDTLDRFLDHYEVPTTGDWFNKGKSWYRAIECPWFSEHENQNQGSSTCIVFTEGGGYGFDCKHRCADKGWKDFRAELEARFPGKAKFRFVESTAEVSIGSAAEAPRDWRSHYHSFEEMESAPPPSFLIDGWLQLDAITALAAPVAQRKSLIALNVAHALCTQEPLFDYFKVSNPPTRVLYLCPEMGIRSFTERVRKIGLLPYVGKTLFCRTMSAEGVLELSELTPEELKGAVVIIDTAVRYLKGDENSSEHMRLFAENIFRLMRNGAASVLLLHHSAKGTKESTELSLENAMRGSGELGAFVSSCWATRLQHPDEPYKSASFLTNVKQRDFESNPFEVVSGPDCRLRIVAEPGDNVKLNSKGPGAPRDADGNEDAALGVIRDNPTLPVRALVDKLKEVGIKRSKSWVGEKRYEVLHTGVKSSA